MKKTMAYKQKGPKAPKADMKAPKLDQSSAPKSKPSMKHAEPPAPWSTPKNDEQSMAPSHSKKALPSKDAPKGVRGVNEGSPISMPQGGGVGETEV